MPSYTIFNTGIDYQLSKEVNIYFNINNLLDKNYENTISYGQPGRTFYLGFKGNW